MKFKLRKGLQLPIAGAVEKPDVHRKNVSKIAILGSDYVGMKPSLLVKEGDRVQLGQPLFTCKKNEGLVFCARASGKVESINRGDKRVFQSLVIATDSSESCVSFKSFKKLKISSWEREEVCQLLVESGEWSSIRQRPFNKVAKVGGTPHSLFITAMDTNPLAPDPKLAIEKWKEEFLAGVEILSKLPQKDTYACFSDQFQLDLPSNVKKVVFSGPHPAGNVGTHIHFLEAVSLERCAWHVSYQDVIAIGSLFLNGQLMNERLVNIAGPMAKAPKFVETRRGACVSELVQGELADTQTRIVSGSVFNGRKAKEAFDFLGHFDNQITLLKEDDSREFLGWQSPGLNKFSTKSIYLSKLLPGKIFKLGTSTHGSKRAMVPIGMFEKVMPMDILPTQLLRSLVSNDIESSQELGCLELAEEDLALCTFVAPGKVDFGPILRRNLDMIEREG